MFAVMVLKALCVEGEYRPGRGIVLCTAVVDVIAGYGGGNLVLLDLRFFA